MKTKIFRRSRTLLPIVVALSMPGAKTVEAAPGGNDERLNVDLSNLEPAAGVSSVEFVDLPLSAPFVSVSIFVEGYKRGKVVFDSRKRNAGSVSSDPPAKAASVKLCVCRRGEQPPKYKIKHAHDLQRVPGTGTTRLGYSFRVVYEHGIGGSGGEVVVSNADFDFYFLKSMKCKDLPFAIVDRHHTTHAVPIVIYLPGEFDPKSLK